MKYLIITGNPKQDGLTQAVTDDESELKDVVCDDIYAFIHQISKNTPASKIRRF